MTKAWCKGLYCLICNLDTLWWEPCLALTCSYYCIQ